MCFIEIIERKSNPLDTLALLYEKKLLIKVEDAVYIECNSNMCVKICSSRHGIKKRFRCIKRNCRKSLSLFKYSIFQNIIIPLKRTSKRFIKKL